MARRATAHAIAEGKGQVRCVLSFLYVVRIDRHARPAARHGGVVVRVLTGIAGPFLYLLRPCAMGGGAKLWIGALRLAGPA